MLSLHALSICHYMLLLHLCMYIVITCGLVTCVVIRCISSIGVHLVTLLRSHDPVDFLPGGRKSPGNDVINTRALHQPINDQESQPDVEMADHDSSKA